MSGPVTATVRVWRMPSFSMTRREGWFTAMVQAVMVL